MNSAQASHKIQSNSRLPDSITKQILSGHILTEKYFYIFGQFADPKPLIISDIRNISTTSDESEDGNLQTAKFILMVANVPAAGFFHYILIPVLKNILMDNFGNEDEFKQLSLNLVSKESRTNYGH